MTVSIFFTSCSSEDESLDFKIIKENQQDENIPVESPNSGPVEIPGFPKRIKKYQNDSLKYWAQYFYKSDGNLLKINYSYPESGTERFTDSYLYNSEGKLIKLNGHDEYTFYWDNDRIVAADKYNGMWYGNSKIFYDYNSKGQLIQKTENNIDFSFSDRTIYSYFEDGNIKTIEQYGDSNGSGDFTLYLVTSFDNYKGDRNLFLEFTIIPGHSVQNQFPGSMSFKHLISSGYDSYETYEYVYDSEGRVVEKLYGKNKIVYEYY